MKWRRSSVGIVIVAMTCAASGMAIARTQESERGSADHRAIRAMVVDANSAGDETAEEVDLSGNDVAPAIATYQLDADGSLYEAHSPQTMLPKLAPPKS